jgi:hypothetical protein
MRVPLVDRVMGYICKYITCLRGAEVEAFQRPLRSISRIASEQFQCKREKEKNFDKNKEESGELVGVCSLPEIYTASVLLRGQNYYTI